MLISASALAGEARVQDADVLWLEGMEYRLAGIAPPPADARCRLPEGKAYDCHAIAKTALMDLVGGAAVQCEPISGSRSDGDPVVARCYADGYDLSEGMVYSGWALADPVTGKTYQPQQDRAREARHGLWRGSFEADWPAAKAVLGR